MGGKEAARQLVLRNALFQVKSEIWTPRGGCCLDQEVFKWVRCEEKRQNEGHHDSFIHSASIHWGVLHAGLCFKGCENNTEEGGNLRLKEDVLKEKKEVILVMLIEKRIKAKDIRNIHRNCDV